MINESAHLIKARQRPPSQQKKAKKDSVKFERSLSAFEEIDHQLIEPKNELFSPNRINI